MHQVIKNLLARKNQTVPINDGRKIALVLFGGIMVGVRGAGALVALQELELTQSFDEVYTMSSGFLNGSAFLAGQAKQSAANYYKQLSGRRFLNLLRFWKIADMKYLLKVIEDEQFNVKRILQSKTKLYNMVINVSKKDRAEYLEVHNFTEAEYSLLVEASLCLKYIAGGSVKIRDDYYRDIIADKAITDFFAHVIDSGATDIMVIYNYPWQQKYIHKNFNSINDQRVFEICPDFDKIKSGPFEGFVRFETRGDVLKSNCQQFGNAVKNLFGVQEAVKLF